MSASTSNSTQKPPFKRGDSLPPAEEAKKTGSFFSPKNRKQGARSGKSSLLNRNTRSQSTDIKLRKELQQLMDERQVKDAKIAALCKTALENRVPHPGNNKELHAQILALKAENSKKDEEIQTLFNLLMDNKVDLDGVLDVSDTSASSAIPSNIEVVQQKASAIDAEMKQILQQVEGLSLELKKIDCDLISVKKSLEGCTITFSKLQDRAASLNPDLEQAIAGLSSQIDKNEEREIDPSQHTAVSKYVGKDMTAITNEIARRREAKEERISQKDALTAISQSYTSTDELISWRLSQTSIQLLSVKAMEKYITILKRLSSEKELKVEEYNHGTAGYKNGLARFSTTLNSVIPKLEEGQGAIFKEVAKRIEIVQALLNRFEKAKKEGKDPVKERQSTIQIRNDELRENVCQMVGANVLMIQAERERTLNQLKALKEQLNIVLEEAKWDVYSMREFGKLKVTIEGISAETSKLDANIDGTEALIRNTPDFKNDGKVSVRNQMNKSLIKYIEDYEKIAPKANEVYKKLQEELSSLREQIKAKLDKIVLNDQLTRVTITDPGLLESVQKDIRDHNLRMVAKYTSSLNELEAIWKGVYEFVNETLPLDITRLKYTLETDGITRLPYKATYKSILGWSCAPAVVSPFGSEKSNSVTGSSSD